VLRAALIAVVAVIAVLACLDRLAAAVVRRRVARLIARAWRTPAVPRLRTSRGPFLIQLISGVYGEVSLTVPEFTAAGMEMRCLDARLTGVRAPVVRLLAGEGLVAGAISANFAIPFDALASRLPPGFAIRRHRGELQIHSTFLPVPVSGIVEINAERRWISVTPRIAGVPSVVGFRVELPALPQEVTINSITVTDEALAVGVAGQQVRLAAANAGSAESRQLRRMRAWRAD
jgi:hypothetical protein